jgi:uncharacterized Zn finger protein
MPSNETLANVLTSDLLLRQAGSVTYARGLAYAHDGRVKELSVQDGVLAAHVRGTETYDVRLTVTESRLTSDCTCPVGEELRFCKHCVAVGLAWLMERGEMAKAQPAQPRVAEDPMTRIRAYLDQQDAQTLRELLLAEANANENLRERLLLRDAAADAAPASLTRLRAAIDRTTTLPDYEDYEDGYAYGGVLDEMVDSLAVLAQTHAAAAIELIEHALWRVEATLSNTHDSDGIMYDSLQRLQEIHLQACEDARPDPVPLAQRLFHGALRAQFDTFSNAAEAYADVLGTAGQAEFRRLARAAWDALPPLGPGERDGDRVAGRWTITHMMEALARAEGGVEALVAVRSRDLSQPHAFLQIAESYRDAGEHEKAMEWARRGLDSFPYQDPRLRTLLADEHHRMGEHEQAMELIWQVFAARPHLDGYELLKQHADRSHSWKPWRERALARLRGDAQAAQARHTALHGAERARSELVRVFLWERDAEAAWAEAQEGGCSPDLWLQLAKARAADHPADALAVYRRQVDRILVDTGERAYAEAVRLLPHIQEIMNRLNEDFSTYVTHLRVTHKRRRRLLEMLDRFDQRATRR